MPDSLSDLPGSPDRVGALRARPIPGGHKRRRAQENPGQGGPAAGEGYGGPARGSWRKFTPETIPTGEAMSAGHAAAKTAREEARKHAVRAVGIWVDVMDNTEAPPMARIVAADKIVERAEGKPEQLTTHRIAAPAPFDPEQLPDESREALRHILLLTQGSPADE